MMDPKELGTMLRTAREHRGLDIAECAKQTGLPREYLLALESGDFDRLPGIAYARIYYLNYARMLGLDAEELQLLWQEPRPLQVEPVKRRHWPLFVTLLVVTAIAVGVGISMRSGKPADSLDADEGPPFASTSGDSLSDVPRDTAGFSQASSLADDSGPVPPESVEADEAAVPFEVADASPSALAMTAEANPTADSVPKVVPKTGGLPTEIAPEGLAYGPIPVADSKSGVPLHKLEIAVRGQTWILIRADGDTTIDSVFTADQVVSAEARREFLLSAARPGVLSVTLDGEKTPLPRREGRSLVGYRIVLHAEDSI